MMLGAGRCEVISMAVLFGVCQW